MTPDEGIPGSFLSSLSDVPQRPNPVSGNAAANVTPASTLSAGTQPPITGSTSSSPSQSRQDLNRTQTINNAWAVYTLTKEIRPDGLQKLTGFENYRSWRDLMRLLLKNLCLSDCLTSIMDIRNTDNPETVGKLTLLQGRCFNYLLQSIDSFLHHFIITHQSPKAIWQALENQYDRQNDMNIHKQFQVIVDSKYDPSGGGLLKDHIVNFESIWTSLASRTNQATATDANKLAYALQLFFQSSEIKASLLLGSLPDSMNNIVENLQTKDNLTYELAYNHLMDLRSSSSVAPSTVETVYKASLTQQPSKFESSDGTDVCSYCQKKGHLWSECRARKRREKNKKEENKKKTGEQAKVADADTAKDESETALTVQPSSSLSTSSWVLDSGATSHMTSNPDCLTRIHKKEGYVKIGDGSRIRIEGVGDIKLALSKSSTIILRDCLYVPSLGKLSLLLVRKCQKNGLHVVGHDDILEVQKPNGAVICHGKDVGNGLFELQMQHDGNQHGKLQHDEHAIITYRQWHDALGHPAFIAPTLYADGDLIPSRPSNFHCKECSLAKSTHRKPAKLRSKSTRSFELIHTDLSGKFSTQSLGKGLYYITFIDDYTRYAWVRILKTKDEAMGAIREFIALVERQFDGAKVARFRCDGGGEYVGKAARAELSGMGIVIEITPPYSPESNGVAERFNRTLKEAVRASLLSLAAMDGQGPDVRKYLFLWAEAVSTAVYTRNRLPHKGLGKPITPYAKLHHGKKPAISHMRPFGALCYVHVPEKSRPAGTQLHPRAVEGRVVGYASENTLYRVYVPSKRTVVVSAQVRFPSGSSWVGPPCSADPSPVPLPPSFDPNDYETFDDTVSSPGAGPSGPNCLGRFDPADYEEFDDLLLVAHRDEPATFATATRCSDWHLWDAAIQSELGALDKNGEWEVVPVPTERRNVVDCKWVFKHKLDADGNISRYKARLVAKGFLQKPGIDYDETFAPVVNYDSLRLLLALSAQSGWKPRQFDVKSAFLYGILPESQLVYMELPPGYRIPGYGAKLKKCLYGLKQSPREWYRRLSTFLEGCGFTATTFDPCVFVGNVRTLDPSADTDAKMYISVYVDDIVLFGPDCPQANLLIDKLKAEFEITDLGVAGWLLGLQITYDKKGIHLSQRTYIQRILDRFQMANARPVVTPMDPGAKSGMSTTKSEIPGTNPSRTESDMTDQKVDNTLYRSIIGSLAYAATGTRPDLSFTVTYLSQFLESTATKPEHMTAAKRVLKYLRKTIDWDLLYPYAHVVTRPFALEGYVDSSWGACPLTRRSHMGYVFRLGKCTISWKARKQRSVATSTTEAEYMAMSLGAKLMMWYKQGLKELGILTDTAIHSSPETDIPMALRSDSQGAIDLAHNPRISDRSRHIDIQYHYTRERLLAGDFSLVYVTTQDNLADICTKALTKDTHYRLSTMIRNQ